MSGNNAIFLTTIDVGINIKYADSICPGIFWINKLTWLIEWLGQFIHWKNNDYYIYAWTYIAFLAKRRSDGIIFSYKL